MYTGRRFQFGPALIWTYPVLVGMFIWSTILAALFAVGGLHWIRVPTLPVTVLGTAVSFYLGFKGNAAYDRLWEARKIWGGIVNTSRTWGTHVLGFVGDDAAHQELLYRHIAWLAALRIRLRRPKPWEHREAWNDAARERWKTLDTSDDAIRRATQDFLDAKELDWLMQRQNHATQLLAVQSRRLSELYAAGAIDDFRHMELANLIETMFTLQGKAERIKAFPLPRQYSTANHWFVKGFIVALPLVMVGEFHDHTPDLVWLAIPVSMAVGWVFYTWDMIVDYSENPFEGLINDIPMTAMSRTIEIDLRDMLGETNLPPSMPEVEPHIAM